MVLLANSDDYPGSRFLLAVMYVRPKTDDVFEKSCGVCYAEVAD